MKGIWLGFLLFFISCRQPTNTAERHVKTKNPGLLQTREKTLYADMLRAIGKKKMALQKLYTNHLPAADITKLEKEFVTVVVDSILPYWYGTPWDFNGVTQTPGEGSIACGYFITTVLQHAGVPINRIRLAQCASQQMITELVTANTKKVFSNASMETFMQYMQLQGFGLYIVGLDSHVGFLYHDAAELHFIHAKWVNPKAVVSELASQSSILQQSAYKIVGKISSDPIFLKKWLKQHT